jgi:hypothetical protein
VEDNRLPKELTWLTEGWGVTYSGPPVVTTSDLISASEKQIGGNHYKDMPIQPSEYITKNGLGWYEGNAIKYISRYKTKHGKQDIEKAIHYLELLLETLE